MFDKLSCVLDGVDWLDNFTTFIRRGPQATFFGKISALIYRGRTVPPPPLYIAYLVSNENIYILQSGALLCKRNAQNL